MAGVEQNRYKTNNGCIKYLPQTGYITTNEISACMNETYVSMRFYSIMIINISLARKLSFRDSQYYYRKYDIDYHSP